MKIKTTHAPDYLTNGKEYEVIHYDDYNGVIINDGGEKTYIAFKGCAHLNGHSWEVVE